MNRKTPSNLGLPVLLALLMILTPAAHAGPAPRRDLKLETVTRDDRSPPAKVQLLYRPGILAKRPVILMLGSLEAGTPPFWSEGLLDEGYMLAAFSVAHPPDPDPAKRPQWLVFDQRFAHCYALGGSRAPGDAARVIDCLVRRDDVNAKKIGWLGSSSTGIPGLAVAAREPRLAAIVAFVSTGAYGQWFDTWHTNKLWVGKTPELWPETIELLKDEPIRHVSAMFPCAVLMVSGGADKVVDPSTARAFVDAARPFYKDDPSRLRLVVYEGFGHNLPRDVVRLYAEHWFHLYLNPTKDPPPPEVPTAAPTLKESVQQTQINSEAHQKVIGAEK
jgi:dienelactone hydrolase